MHIFENFYITQQDELQSNFNSLRPKMPYGILELDSGHGFSYIWLQVITWTNADQVQVPSIGPKYRNFVVTGINTT